MKAKAKFLLKVFIIQFVLCFMGCSIWDKGDTVNDKLILVAFELAAVVTIVGHASLFIALVIEDEPLPKSDKELK